MKFSKNEIIDLSEFKNKTNPDRKNSGLTKNGIAEKQNLAEFSVHHLILEIERNSQKIGEILFVYFQNQKTEKNNLPDGNDREKIAQFFQNFGEKKINLKTAEIDSEKIGQITFLNEEIRDRVGQIIFCFPENQIDENEEILIPLGDFKYSKMKYSEFRAEIEKLLDEKKYFFATEILEKIKIKSQENTVENKKTKKKRKSKKISPVEISAEMEKIDFEKFWTEIEKQKNEKNLEKKFGNLQKFLLQNGIEKPMVSEILRNLFPKDENNFKLTKNEFLEKWENLRKIFAEK